MSKEVYERIHVYYYEGPAPVPGWYDTAAAGLLLAFLAALLIIALAPLYLVLG